ncbi:triose-phosphate isomerase [Candidatus Bathyarchaeota archaeon]|nr:triose-phosphate isomerase [Candidatus Bathyarchaeota archaeon]
MAHSRISPPIILLNFKCYLEATGAKAVQLAKYAQQVSEKFGVIVAVAPQAADIRLVSQQVKVPVFAQHIDPIAAGSHTGHMLAESVLEAGASGVIINHSERRLRADVIEDTIVRARGLGLTTTVCANTPEIAEAIAALNPDMVAVEPPELIGSGVAVSKAKPEIITDTVSRIRRINKDVMILCGAGITSGNDVREALRLGTQGVILASGVVKAKNQLAAIEDLASGCRR